MDIDGPDTSSFNSLNSLPELKYEILKIKNSHDIFFANIRSIRKNFDSLIEMLEQLEHNFSFIILNETWLENNEIDMFKIENYDVVSMPRTRHGAQWGHRRKFSPKFNLSLGQFRLFFY